MSQQVDEIFAKYKKVFISDQENLKKYLLTHYERAFKTRQVLNVERIDNTERIKLSGFNKYLSSWRNFYQNIVVTSCVLVNNVEKRYDYKFYFTKEKLDDATIEKIERALEESARLRRNFKFNEAIALIDEMLELIQKKKDVVTNKVLNDARKEIVEAQEKHDKIMIDISKLDNKIKVAQEYDNLKGIPKNCENIIKLADSIGRKDLVNKYKRLEEETQREIEQRKAKEKQMALEETKSIAKRKEKESYDKAMAQIANLEEKIKTDRANGNLKAAITDCEKIINIANLIDKEDFIVKYSKLYENLSNELEAKEARERKMAIKSKEALKRQKTEKKRKKLEAKRALKEQKKREKEKLHKEKEKLKEQQILEKIEFLEENVRINQKSDSLEVIVSDCRQIIKLANSIDREDIAEQYGRILEDTQTEIEKRKAEEILTTLAVKETVDSRLIYKEVISNKFLIYLCIIGGILIIIHAVLNIMLLISTIYTNMVVDIRILNIRLETRDTFFIFLFINACVCIVSGSLIIVGSIGLFSNKILFGRAMIIYGIFIALMGAPSLLIVGIWAGSLSGNFAPYIMIYVFIYFIICLVGVVFIDFALWRIRTERIRVPGIQKFKIRKRFITEKKIGKDGITYTKP